MKNLLMQPFKHVKWVFHPISILVMAQIVWGLLMFLWIRWYLLRSREINHLVQKIPLPNASAAQWVILAQGCILMAFLLVALYIIFVSQRRLYRLTKMQDAILSSVTHELKTPLASIRLYTETLLAHNLSVEKSQSFLHRILNESSRLQKLIDTVLVSARLEGERPKEYAKERVNLSKMVEKCLHKLRERAMETREISSIVEPALYVHGHEEHLMILFDNLMDNALKYTSVNGCIEVRLFRVPRTKVIQFEVHDNGIGIHKHDLKKIFRKFYRIERHAFHSVKGSGLGLWVCRSIARAHGARLSVQSNYGEGSRFNVLFKRFSSFD